MSEVARKRPYRRHCRRALEGCVEPARAVAEDKKPVYSQNDGRRWRAGSPCRALWALKARCSKRTRRGFLPPGPRSFTLNIVSVLEPGLPRAVHFGGALLGQAPAPDRSVVVSLVRPLDAHFANDSDRIGPCDTYHGALGLHRRYSIFIIQGIELGNVSLGYRDVATRGHVNDPPFRLLEELVTQ